MCPMCGRYLRTFEECNCGDYWPSPGMQHVLRSVKRGRRPISEACVTIEEVADGPA